VWVAAYNTENFRAAIESVPAGIQEGTRSLGLRPIPAFMLVTLPLAWRIALPSVTNTSIETLKNTALMVAISFPELTTTVVDHVAVSFRVFELFMVLGAAYLLLGAAIAKAFRAIEARLALPT
jgi:polar amino acid transport system permease protein